MVRVRPLSLRAKLLLAIVVVNTLLFGVLLWLVHAANRSALERGGDAFRRSFTLPATVDASRVDASYQDGVLTVKLPRREEARPKAIKIG